MQQGDVEAASGDGGQDQRVACASAQTLDAAAHGILHGTRDAQLDQRPAIPHPAGVEDVSGGDKRGEHLLDEEGIAVGERIDGIQEVGADRAIEREDGPQHRLDLGRAETAQGQLGGHAPALQLRQDVNQARVRLIGAVGQQQEDGPSGDLASQVEQELQARLVAPVQVLDHHEYRTGGALSRQEPGERVKEALLPLLRPEGWRGNASRQQVVHLG